MTRHQWISHLCRALILGELASAAVLITDHRMGLAAVVVCTVPSLVFLDACARRAHHRARAAHEQARRRAVGDHPEPVHPCCLSQAARELAPDHHCTRPL